MIMRVTITGGKVEISKRRAQDHLDIDHQRRVMTNHTTKAIMNVPDEEGIPSPSMHPLHLQNGSGPLALLDSKSRPSIDTTKRAVGIDLVTKNR